MHNRRRKDAKPIVMPKTPVEMHRFIIEHLMENPDKKDAPQDDDMYAEYVKPPDPPDFVRHVLGSNSGAGSGEFHVYRIQRKFEHRRVKYFENQLKEEKAQLEFDENNKRLALMETEKTTARRTKRIQKRKKADDRKKLHRQFAIVLAEHNKKAEEFDASL
uniref:PRKR-interacting protein 1 homolog (Trinotate prediction) n=1 Tax=Myxobolus squamalis TaxID=59785 RepID=A0A6B2G5E6_MYXSQ